MKRSRLSENIQIVMDYTAYYTAKRAFAIYSLIL